MDNPVLVALRQTQPFGSPGEELFVALQMAAARAVDPWAQELKRRARLTPVQYNVLRILRGARPAALSCRQIGERMITRDPDVTRLVDRLVTRGLVRRARPAGDRRVVEVAVTAAGLAVLRGLDGTARALPSTVFGALSTTQLRQLGALLGRVVAHLEPDGPPRGRTARSSA